MILFLPVLVCLLTATANFALTQVKGQARNPGLINSLSSIFIWILVAVAIFFLPMEIEIPFIETNGLNPILIQFQIDIISWALGTAITSLLLIIVLTASQTTDTMINAGNFALVGAGLAALFSNNPITLAMWWTVIDVVELLVYFHISRESPQRERIVYNLAVRLSGTFVLLISALGMSTTQGSNTFFTGSTLQGLFLLLAGFLRLGAIPFVSPIFPRPDLRRGTGTLLTMVPAASAMILLTRIDAPIFPDRWNVILFVLIFIVGFASSLVWLIDQDVIRTRPYWITGIASLIFASAINGIPEAAATWSLTMLLGASVLFTVPIHGKITRWFMVTAAFLLTGLPYTPNWPGMSLFSFTSYPINLVFLIPLVILIMGVSKHSWKQSEDDDVVSENYSIGQILSVGFLSANYLLLGLALILSWEYAGQLWIGLVVLLLWAGLIYAGRRRAIRVPTQLSTGWRDFSSLGWLYRVGGIIFRSLARVTNLFSNLIEGETGTLWSLLLLVALISLLNILF